MWIPLEFDAPLLRLTYVIGTPVAFCRFLHLHIVDTTLQKFYWMNYCKTVDILATALFSFIYLVCCIYRVL